MIAYEFYWLDESGDRHLIGVLPERRKDLERITEESILNWGREFIGDNPEGKSVRFVKIKWY